MSYRALKVRRQNKNNAQAATEYIIQTPSATYRSAAKKFCVSVNSIRARINYRYGSLMEARLHADTMVKTWSRPCMSCGTTERRFYGQFRCDDCLAAAQKLHDGIV